MKILLMNAYNTYNYGAMMMVENFITYMNERVPELEFYIECATEDNLNRIKEGTGYDLIYPDKMITPTKTDYKGKIGKISYKLKELLLIKKSKYYDVVIILGGDTFSEIYSKHIGVYLTWYKINKLNQSTKLFMVGQTIGPYTEGRKKYVSKVLKEVDLYTRDERSRKYLEDELDVKCNSMRDLAFLPLNLQKEYNKKAKTILKKYGLTENNYVTIVGTGLMSLYTKDTELFMNKFMDMVKELKNRYPDKKILWLSHVTGKTPNDNTMLDEINNKKNNFINKNMVVIREDILPVEARIILGFGYFTITCRMHAAVSTFNMGKPAICLSYSPKYAGVIADSLDMSEIVIESKGDDFWQGKPVKQIMDCVQYIEKNYDKLCKTINKKVKECQDNVLSTLDEIANLTKDKKN